MNTIKTAALTTKLSNPTRHVTLALDEEGAWYIETKRFATEEDKDILETSKNPVYFIERGILISRVRLSNEALVAIVSMYVQFVENNITPP